MYARFALIVGCLHIESILAQDPRFETHDDLAVAGDDLQYAFIIFRHGIRSPINNIYGSDEEFLKIWPDGKGSLTEDGKRLMAHVGRSLRTRYRKLVPDYDKDIVEVTSTKSPRATMSAYCVAAGMFLPKEIMFDDIPMWQPVPVWHTAAAYDKAPLFDETQQKAQCPRYTKIRDSIIREEMKKLPSYIKSNLNKINEKLKNSKSPIKTIKNLDDFFNMWDVYFMEKLSLQSSESWTEELMPAMTDIGEFRLWSRMHGKNDGKASILQYFTGLMLSQVLNEMLKKSSDCIMKTLKESEPYNEPQPPCKPRLHLHGSHDLTVGALMWALTNNRKKEKFMAYPGDALILEMYQDRWIKLFLYSPLSSEKERMQHISLKDLCGGENCRYEQLVKGLNNVGLSLTQEEWRAKCDNLDGVERIEGAKWRKIP